MGALREALVCGYFDDDKNYIVEIDTQKLIDLVDENYKDFMTNMSTKVKLYDILKIEFTKNLDTDYREFVVEFIGGNE